MKGKKYEGFSLIEILVVVALIIILATITIVAINPAKNFRDTRDAQRNANVSAILNAITQYTSEQGNALGDFGTIPACTTDWKVGAKIGTDTGNINLATRLVPDFIVEIPMDPTGGTAEDTGYVICSTAEGRVQISAPKVENTTKTISVKR